MQVKKTHWVRPRRVWYSSVRTLFAAAGQVSGNRRSRLGGGGWGVGGGYFAEPPSGDGDIIAQQWRWHRTAEHGVYGMCSDCLGGGTGV